MTPPLLAKHAGITASISVTYHGEEELDNQITEARMESFATVFQVKMLSPILIVSETWATQRPFPESNPNTSLKNLQTISSSPHAREVVDQLSWNLPPHPLTEHFFS